MFNPAKWVAATKGIPASFTSGANVPSTSTRLRLLNGIEVDQKRYEYFSDAIKSFAKEISTLPHQVPRLAQQLGHRLVEMHTQELKQYGDMLARYYDKPHIDRWNEHRANLRKSLASDPELGGARHDESIRKSKTVTELYAAHKGDAAKAAFLKMAGETGSGDHPEMHRFLNFIADLLKGGPARDAYDAGDTRDARRTSRSGSMYPTDAARKPASAPAIPAPTKPRAASKSSKMYDSPHIAPANEVSAPRTQAAAAGPRTKVPPRMTAAAAGKAAAGRGTTPTTTKSRAKRLYGG